MPTKSPSPLLGYNNNVRHKGKVFHVQTEDSGVKYGHIITHLFMDGGRILKSVKTSYSEYVENDRMGEIVREMMKQQHKAMFIALRDGKFDSVIEGADGSRPSQALRAAAPVDPAPPSDAIASAAAEPPVSRTVPMSPAPSPDPPSGIATRAAEPRPRAFASPRAPAVEGIDEGDAPQTLRQAAEDLTLDVDAVEAARTDATVRTSVDLPVPPANLFRDKVVTGKYRAIPPAVTPQPTPSNSVRSASTNAPIATSTSRAPAAERRYAPTRPASIFGQAKPQQGKTIFGEDLIGDKSLDEVILSYLAEDLDGESKK